MESAQRFTYGPDPLQFVDLHRAAGDGAAGGDPLGTVILIHGGYWRYDPTYFEGPTPMAREFARLGYTTWQVEYRAMGARGGWPETLQDVAAAIDLLATVSDAAPGLQLGKVVTVGHSAGGHLAVWALGESAAGALGLPIAGAVSLAGVLDLRLAERDNLGRRAVANFLGGTSDEVPERYDTASPAEHPVADRAVRLIHGTGDDVVPVSQSEAYLAAALRAGQPATLETFDGDHFDVIDIHHPSWQLTLAAVRALTHSPQR
ncbi:MAG TPA: alpha/beta fold hydrolase [Galbitalea sp.]